MKDHLPNYCPFQDMSPKEYWELVKCVNENNRRDLASKFEDLPFENAALIIVGSDGKEERHCQSKPDIILIRKSGAELDLSRRLVDAIGKEEFYRSYDFSHTGLPETRGLDQSTPLSFAFNDPSKVYPDRILNAKIIAGDEDVYYSARERILAEISKDGEESKKIREHMKSQLWLYKKAIKTGVYAGRMVFDGQSQYYDEDNANYSVGFKIAFLRAAQRKLDLMTIKAVRTGRLDIVTAARDLPTATDDRLEYFADMEMFPRELLSGSVEAYGWFLQQYHCAQEKYKDSKNAVKELFDPNKFADYKSQLMGFLDLRIK